MFILIKIHAGQCLYNKFILSGRFFPCFQILFCIQKNPSRLISKQLGKKDFSGELIRLNAGARGEHLTSQLTWAAA